MDSVASHVAAAAATAQTGHQQFCLRWHNHQTSLLSSLPLLLDQSHLTDVTLSADGRTIRAHRVVLSACSAFFSELFRTLEPPFHPVVILPGTSFTALVALLTFMYSGEVNVYEEQISSLLSLAETLGIKGLADFNGNISKTPPKESPTKEQDSSPLVMTKLSPLDNLFVKPFHFYSSHSMPQPLNFSQNSSRNSENNFYKTQHQNHTKCHQEHLDNLTVAHGSTAAAQAHNDTENISNISNKSSKNSGSGSSNNSNNSSSNINNNRKGGGSDVKRKQISDMRKIDKIAENLRCGTSGKSYYEPKMTHLIPQSPPRSLILKPPPQSPLPPPFNPHNFMPDDLIPKTPESLSLMDVPQSSVTPNFFSNENLTTETMLEKSMTAVAPKPGNSKLYATCFICHKQLSNQYNLRVHLETHQNVRYACTVCTHVSRSKDALRKHVSYRHPGTPSPCDSETRRKRTKHNNNAHIKQEMMDPSSSLQQALAGTTAPHTPTPPIQCIPDVNTSASSAAASAAAANTAATTTATIKTTSTEPA